MKKLVVVISAIAASLLFNLNDASAQVVVRVRPVAPVIIRERPAAPHPNWFWIDGFWRWQPRRHEYTWVDGYWVKPRRGHVWVPGYWRDAPGGSLWIEGRWTIR